MAIGDEAAAVDMDLVADSAPRREGAQEINKTRDYIAFFTQLLRTADVAAVADTLVLRGAGGRTNVGDPLTDTNAVNRGYCNGNRTTSASDLTSGTLSMSRIANQAITGPKIADGAIDVNQLSTGITGVLEDTNDGLFSTAPYNREITGTRRAGWIQSDGKLGYASSSRHKKQNIRPAELTMEQLRAIPVVLYRYRKQVAAERAGKIDHAPTEIGTIAEDLHALELWQFVMYENGKPVGVHYELLALAALSLGQQLADRLDEFEVRLSALEAKS